MVGSVCLGLFGTGCYIGKTTGVPVAVGLLIKVPIRCNQYYSRVATMWYRGLLCPVVAVVVSVSVSCLGVAASLD